MWEWRGDMAKCPGTLRTTDGKHSVIRNLRARLQPPPPPPRGAGLLKGALALGPVLHFPRRMGSCAPSNCMVWGMAECAALPAPACEGRQGAAAALVKQRDHRPTLTLYKYCPLGTRARVHLKGGGGEGVGGVGVWNPKVPKFVYQKQPNEYFLLVKRKYSFGCFWFFISFFSFHFISFSPP